LTNYYRTLAARGLNPNYVGAGFGWGGVRYGTLVSYEHFDKTTVVIGRSDEGVLFEVDFDHLEEVDVYA
jgi:hypothetical protein